MTKKATKKKATSATKTTKAVSDGRQRIIDACDGAPPSGEKSKSSRQFLAQDIIDEFRNLPAARSTVRGCEIAIQRAEMRSVDLAKGKKIVIDATLIQEYLEATK